MALYSLHYTLSGEPKVDARMEYNSDDLEGIFSKLERIQGLSTAVLYEDDKQLGVVRRNAAGIWEIG
ncbi:hypothetical protein K3181_03025 [Qipengyuania sp. YG27]|uniref:Uncharacterized protein n=1 Tax=Qipengyuania mesophila TaxID=2867246 RepID=A0ABS7JS23_9SPHN|nr:hypothetical protein [Qipengyuania mesophila]MBX7500418.1 hypothetical protein [Qipengyuania mesophila]